MNPADRPAYAAITAAWALAAVLVGPAGNFPITDDWSYATAVRSLVFDGEWRLHDWTSMPLATQMIWGALFSWLFGFSFQTLRASTLVLAWIATLGVYTLMRQCGADRRMAAAHAAAIAICPIFFPLAFTFMTDVPAIAFAVWALVCILRFLERGKQRDLIAAVALLIATTLIRQTGVALAAAAACAIISVSPTRKGCAAAACALILPVTALVLYDWSVVGTGGPALYSVQRQEIVALLTTAPEEAIRRARVLAPIFFLYLGVFLLPVVFLLRQPSGSRNWTAVGIVFVAFLVYLPVRGHVLPRLSGSLYDIAVYPLVMFRRDLWPHAPYSFWFALTAAALFTAAVAAYQAARALPALWHGDSHARSTAVLCVLGTFGYLVPYALVPAFDRYLVIPAILIMMLLTRARGFDVRSGTLAATVAMIAVVAAFDVAATRDYFAFSRARWAALDAILSDGVPPREIRGGLEVSGWLGASYGFDVEEIRHWSSLDASPSAVISLGPLPGYTAKRSYEFPRLIGTGDGVVYDLRCARR